MSLPIEQAASSFTKPLLYILHSTKEPLLLLLVLHLKLVLAAYAYPRPFQACLKLFIFSDWGERSERRSVGDGQAYGRQYTLYKC